MYNKGVNLKKSELIAMLNKLEGDPDLLMWNGFVGDWHDIEIVQGSKLVKHSLCHLFKAIKHKRMGDKKSFKLDKEELKYCYKLAKKQYHTQEWEFPNCFVEQEKYEDWYGDNQRDVVMIQGKNRGKECYDRLGSMSY